MCGLAKGRQPRLPLKRTGRSSSTTFAPNPKRRSRARLEADYSRLNGSQAALATPQATALRFEGPYLYYPGWRLVPAPLRAFVDFIKVSPGEVWGQPKRVGR